MPRKRSEVTGKAVASIAGRILRKLKRCKSQDMPVFADVDRDFILTICTVGELEALAASALTQAEDKPSGGRTIFVSSLAAAMKAARSGETIKVRKGTYKQKSKRNPGYPVFNNPIITHSEPAILKTTKRKPVFAMVTTTHGKHRKTSKQPITRNTLRMPPATFLATNGFNATIGVGGKPKRKPARKAGKK